MLYKKKKKKMMMKKKKKKNNPSVGARLSLCPPRAPCQPKYLASSLVVVVVDDIAEVVDIAQVVEVVDAFVFDDYHVQVQYNRA